MTILALLLAALTAVLIPGGLYLATAASPGSTPAGQSRGTRVRQADTKPERRRTSTAPQRQSRQGATCPTAGPSRRWPVQNAPETAV